MPQAGPDVPVAFFVFNRPEPTAAVLDRIRQVRPRRLLIVADGPRADVPADAGLCREVRRIVTEVDWPCEVSMQFADTNLGCRTRMATGLDWVFAQVEQAVVLEDDCVPDPSFFGYCSELLHRYRDDSRVMHIGGHRVEGPDLPDGASYRFSHYPGVWGWATWADRWKRFDLEMSHWQRLRATDWLEELLPDRRASGYWRRTFDAMVAGMDAWDYAWVFACWRAGGLSIRPNINLIGNVGFGSDATHLHLADPGALARAAAPMPLPLTHPPVVAADHGNDEVLEWALFSGSTTRMMRMARQRAAATAGAVRG